MLDRSRVRVRTEADAIAVAAEAAAALELGEEADRDLAYSTNRSIGGRPPSEYVMTLEKQAGVDSAEIDRIIGTHLIEAEHLRSDSFESFFEARANGLLDLIGEAMGKEPIRDETEVAEAEAATFEDEPDEVAHEIAADDEELFAAPA